MIGLRSTRRLSLIGLLALVLCGSAWAQGDESAIPKGTLLDVTGAIPDVAALDEAGVQTREMSGMARLRRGPSGWITEGPWELDLATSPFEGGPTGAFAGMSSGRGYPAGADARLISPRIQLAPGTRSTLVFQEAFEIESGYDQGLVEVSTDGGRSWRPVDARSGRSRWREYRVDLTRFAGEEVQVAFRLLSDESEEYGGWFLDAIKVVEGPAVALGAAITSLSSQTFPFLYLNVAVSDGDGPRGTWLLQTSRCTRTGCSRRTTST